MDIRSINKEEDITAFLELLDGKNLNFLIGAGASMPYLKGLSFGSTGLSFEDLYEFSRKENDSEATELLSQYFYWNSLADGTYDSIQNNSTTQCMEVRESYYKMIRSLARMLNRRTITVPKRVNLFTTNYDMFFEYSFDSFIKENPWAYYNDGSYGFVHKYISTERFHIRVDTLGVDSRFSKELPMFNLIKLHGSLNWKIDSEINKVMIDNNLINTASVNNRNDLNKIVEKLTSKDIQSCVNELKQEAYSSHIDWTSRAASNLLNSMAIVLPTKGKFHETVFEEHYYQSLRILSQELERKQSVLIAFGFSFADEHIESIIKRSLINPQLLVLIICFNEGDVKTLKAKFSNYENVFLVVNKLPISSGVGDFSFLNLLLEGSSNE